MSSFILWWFIVCTSYGSFIAQILERTIKNLSLLFRNILKGLVEFTENLHYQLAIICVFSTIWLCWWFLRTGTVCHVTVLACYQRKTKMLRQTNVSKSDTTLSRKQNFVFWTFMKHKKRFVMFRNTTVEIVHWITL